MMNDKDIIASALAHHEAEAARKQIQARSQFVEAMTIDDAYKVQAAWVEMKRAQGRTITGRKVGLTSRAMQEAMKIDEPDFGTLLDDMAFSNGAALPAADFCDPRIEVELAFVLKSSLRGVDVSLDDVLAATEYVVPALELIAARSFRIDPETGYTRTVLDTISDNAANAGYILGDMQIDPYSDLPWVGAVLSRNGVVEETGLAAGVLGHPAHGLVWLAKRFAPHGIALEAGHVFLAGSFTRPVIVRPGDDFAADYGPYGQVSVSYT